MSSQDFQDQLLRRASRAEVILTPALAGQLEVYYRLLAHWNASINLTALPLSPITDQAIDRLLIEPVAAARFLTMPAPIWFDIGSGGGSPAIPLRLARPGGQLMLVESKERKAAFLQEAVRALHMDRVQVEAQRIEAVAASPTLSGIADLITVRAVRVDRALFEAIAALLRAGGQVLFFGAKHADLRVPRDFEVLATPSASESAGQTVVILRRIGL